MKKYWKLIALITIIVLTLGTIYIGSAIEASKYPSFTIEHVNGHEDEVKPVTIHANYKIRDHFLHPQISSQGTTYYKSSSYIGVLKEYGLPSEIKHLQKEYRSFMRGKSEEVNKYFEDENIVAHVNINYDFVHEIGSESGYSFEVSVMDRQTKKTTTFDIPITMGVAHDYMDIQDIQFIDGKLKVFTVHDLVTDVERAAENEIHLYSIDIETEKLVSDDVIDFSEGTKETDQYTRIYTIDNGQNIEPHKYIVYTIEENKDTDTDDGGYDTQLLGYQMIAYNLETDEQVEIELPEAYRNEAYPMALKGSTLFFTIEGTDGIEVIGYNLETGKVETEQKFSIPEMEDESISRYVFENDKVYIVYQLNVGKIDSKLMIGDPETGEILYEGTLKLATSDKSKKVNDVYIDEINVMKE